MSNHFINEDLCARSRCQAGTGNYIPQYLWDVITCQCPSYLLLTHKSSNEGTTVHPKKYAHGFVVLCFVVVMQSFIMISHEVFIHIHQGCFAGTGAIVRLPQCQWSKHDGYGKISQCITTTKHSKAKTVCIFLGIYCIRSLFSLWEEIVTWKRFPLNDIFSVWKSYDCDCDWLSMALKISCDTPAWKFSFIYHRHLCLVNKPCTSLKIHCMLQNNRNGISVRQRSPG